MVRRSRSLLAALLLSACGGGASSGGAPDGGRAPDAEGPEVCGDGVVTGGEVCDDGVNDTLDGGCMPGCRRDDRSAELFARPLIDVQIELPTDEWDALRHERKTTHEVYGMADCRAAPIENPYLWHLGTVTIDGTTLPQVGLRKRGHIGSQSTLRPSLKLAFDKEDHAQSYLGMGGFGLNNNKSDPSLSRTCLTYHRFAAAGVPAPRCTLATVTVNGTFMGVYTAVENVDYAFVARRLPDASGNLYEGTAADFRPDFVGGFEQETNADTDGDRADLQAVTDVISATPDDELLAALAPRVDLDAFYVEWAAESFVWDRDGYDGNANNFFVYADPADGGRFRFFPWGPDAAFNLNGTTTPDSVLAFSALSERLYQLPEARARYDAALDAIVAAWDADAAVAEVEQVTALAAPHLADADRIAQVQAAGALEAVLRGRAGAIAAARADGDPAWTEGMRSLPCRIPAGPISATFATTWGSLATNIFTAGSGTVTVALHGADQVVTRMGSRAGVTSTGGDRVQLSADVDTSRRLSMTADLPDPRWFDPFVTVGDHDLIRPPVNMSLTETDLTTGAVISKYEIGEGTWTFDAVSRTPGAAVTGHLSATLYQIP